MASSVPQGIIFWATNAEDARASTAKNLYLLFMYQMF
jgi:hypothetical protein